ncbi:MAG: domain S-box [Cyanobacteria bacterium RYN_339]|nr:domain S-box [Cyanobacteria bacterium RYN_339]
MADAPLLSVRRVLLVNALIPLLVIVLLGVLLAWQLWQTKLESDWVAHSMEVDRHASTVAIALDKMEAGRRGYAITGHRSMVKPYDEARNQVEANLAALETLVAAEPFERTMVHDLRERTSQLDAVVRTELALIARDAPHFQEAASGDALLVETRSGLTAFRAAENQLMQARQERLRHDGWILGGLGLAGLWFACGFFAFFSVRQSRELDRSYRANEQLLQEQQRFARRQELILDAAGEGIYVTDGAGRITFANPAVTKLTGYSQAELHGREAQPLLHPGDRLRISAALRTGEVQRGADEVVRHQDGRCFPVEYVSTPFAEGSVVIFKDIASRVEIDRLKDQLLGVVSHELRTPLTAVRGALEILGEGILGDLTPEALDLVAIADENVLRLARLVNDLVDLERLNAGMAFVELQPLEASELLRRTEAAMRGLAAAAGVTLEVESPVLEFAGDSERLLQVLTNLVSNALKFSPDGHRIWLRAARQGDRVVFEVEDQGRGIPEEKLEAIFERFQQVSPADARQQGGLGLGLAICRGIVQQHGGRIAVESKVGRGSTFRISLPAPVAKDRSFHVTLA